MAEWGRFALLAVLVACTGAVPAVAQYEEEDDDWAQQDRRYQERYEKKDAEDDSPEPPPPADPEEARQALMAEFLAEADELIRDRDYRSRSSEHFRLKTDDPRIDSKAAVELLESFHGFFDEFWSGRTELTEEDGPGPLYLFYSYYKFNKLLFDNPRFGPFRPIGHYRRIFDVVVIHTDGTVAADMPNVLVHETAHLLASRRLFGGAGSRSPWVMEGLAAYFEYTARDKRGAWEPGKVGAKGVALVRGADGRTTSARSKYEELRAQVKSSPDWRLDTVLRMRDPSAFYGPGANGRYAASWLTVHYLFHGDDGAHADAFVRYLEKEAGDGAEIELLYDLLAIEPAALQENVLSHARKLRM
jgi:hypothetical protein